MYVWGGEELPHTTTKREMKMSHGTITLLSWEAEYLKDLLLAQENDLFAEMLSQKLDNIAHMARNFYDNRAGESPRPNARRSDPGTSKAAGVSVAMRAGSQKHILLQAYADLTAGLTDEEAGHNSGLARKPKCCYWKRCSELRQAGLIAVTGETRASSVGEQQQVCAITEAGLLALSRN
jgi:hypothetical protein